MASLVCSKAAVFGRKGKKLGGRKGKAMGSREGRGMGENSEKLWYYKHLVAAL